MIIVSTLQSVYRSIDMNKILFLIILLEVTYAFSQTFTDVTYEADLRDTAATALSVAITDFNNDEWFDIFVTGNVFFPVFEDKFYLNTKDGKFENIIDTIGIRKYEWEFDMEHWGFWGDFDNDGYDDLYYKIDTIYKNMQGNKLVGIKYIEDTLFNRANGIVMHPYGLDFNNDGKLDIVVRITGLGDMNFLQNKGNFLFEKVDESLWGLPKSYIIRWTDFNNDNKIDFYLIPRISWDSVYAYIYLNNGNWTFSKLNFRFPWGAPALFDYNNDGYIDVYIRSKPADEWPPVPGDPDLYLFKNNGDSTFTDVSKSLGIRPRILGKIGWGGVIYGDFNNDGWMDLYQSQNNTYTVDYLFINEEGKRFINIIPDSVNMTNGYSSVIIDYDNDGDLDIYSLTSGSSIPTPGEKVRKILWRNNLKNNNNWIQIKLEGKKSNRNGIGSIVRIYTTQTNNKRLIQKQIYGSTNIYNQNMPLIHFGLGASTSIDSISINWPSGIYQVIRNISVNDRITVVEDTLLTSIGNYLISKISEYDLYQNYPNPFNSKTIIKYRIAKRSNVTIKVFDVLGREVATLINETVPPGTYEIDFNADKYKIASGVYFYQLRSGSFSSTKKFLLMK